ncbi:MAG: glycosyl hydrolase [Calothrix sp. C42_A2020_038]|nr:glycosyl hydrolase [Calothrix sp. C42_A2020_038]
MRQLPLLFAIIIPIGLCGCFSGYSFVKQPVETVATPINSPQPPINGDSTSTFLAALPESTPNRELLAQSWDGYRRRFIQSDGRVIDYEASDRSTSEGQAYAMLRAVIIDDADTFALTLKWGENNLQRQIKGKQSDSLWAWKWGKRADGTWGSIDDNFASDGDIDAITALIFASRRWNRPDYLELAKTKLRDLWRLSTATGANGKPYLLPGPREAFVPNPSTLYLNPSYLAPYAFRIFATVDREHDWLSLVDTSYQVLEKSVQISKVGLPSDWVALDIKTGQYQALEENSPIQSLYSFDAYRVWWRVALDAVWFDSKQARQYLKNSTKHLQQMWRTQNKLPARIDLQGKGLVDYEATSQYAMLYSAWSLVEPELGQQVLTKKLLPRYKQGIWDDDSSYYTQNLAWLGLVSPSVLPRQLLQAQ